MGEALHVVATAGHVDHGKSSLILRLTGIDPDRLAEEKRRGLTIDLGFAWTVLPSGREVGFVDVPGHERFIRNMLAGVGPVRLVLFVVAADEGWKPQSEEHLQIVDVLGVKGAVVALTKRDLVDDDGIAARTREIEARLARTGLEGAPIVACSATTGEGLNELRSALDSILAETRTPEGPGRPRQFIDRVFTIRGAGTVVTGTLTGGPLSVGQEAEILPSGHRARIRGLQTHKRSLPEADPVTRVATNLAGTPRQDLGRGDVLVLPGQWRATSSFEAEVWPVRGLDHPLTSRGAYKLHVGSAEREVRLRFHTPNRDLAPPGTGRPTRAFARLTTDEPLVLDFGDAFVVREVGRRETVAGGRVLDTNPVNRPSNDDPRPRLRKRAAADRLGLAALLVEERGAVRVAAVATETGLPLAELPGTRIGSWLLSDSRWSWIERTVTGMLGTHHQEHPLLRGMAMGEARATLAEIPDMTDQELADGCLARLVDEGTIVREQGTVRLPDHRPSTTGRSDAERLVEAVAAAEPTPPTVRELTARGFTADLIRAVCADGRLVRVSQDIVMTPTFVARGEAIVREWGAPAGITVSEFRERLGTTRKFALPMLEHFDARGFTRRAGDVRVLRR